MKNDKRFVEEHAQPAVEPAVEAVRPPTTLTEDARTFVRLRNLRKERMALAEENDELIARLEAVLLKRFAEEKVGSLNVDGTTLSKREEVWPALIEADGLTPDEVRFAAVQALIEMGRTDAVNYNTQTMRTIVRELAEEGGDGTLSGPIGLFVRAERRLKISARGVSAKDNGKNEG